jgi:RNA polymerase sigma-70 factor, ECF subfamily
VQEPSDSELLARTRQRDAAAFAILIRRHDRYLYRVARSVVSNDEEAEDVIQEAFIRAYTAVADFREDASLRTWLTRIVLNEAARRRQRQRPMVNLDALHAEQERNSRAIHARSLTAPDRDPERATAQNQIRKLLEKAIDELPEAFRTVFIMRDVEGVSVSDTARYLELREETVKTRLHRARRTLRNMLGDHIASALKDVFPFDKPRCNVVVESVLGRCGCSRI